MVKIFESPQKLAENFVAVFAEMITNNGNQKTWHIALSGGSTPKLFMQIMAATHSNLMWETIHFYWSDERCVPPSHDDSNFTMTKKILLSKIVIPANNIHRIRGESNPVSEAKRYTNEIITNVPLNNGLPQFDLIMLGVGDDGHTASLFPNQMELIQSEAICEVATHPLTKQKRITLTTKVINNAQQVAFLVTGASKAAKVEQIVNKTGDYLLFPASYVSPTHGQVAWYLDQSAASLIS